MNESFIGWSLLWLLLFSTVSTAQVVKLSLANYMPVMHINSVLMGKFCEDVNKRLAGKVKVTQYTGGTLLSAPKMAAGVASGIADIGLAHCSYSRGRFPVMELTELPLGAPSSFVLTHVINDFYDKFKPKEWEAYHALMFSASPPSVIQTVNKPIKDARRPKRGEDQGHRPERRCGQSLRSHRSARRDDGHVRVAPERGHGRQHGSL